MVRLLSGSQTVSQGTLGIAANAKECQEIF